jgi:hypothetical protein
MCVHGPHKYTQTAPHDHNEQTRSAGENVNGGADLAKQSATHRNTPEKP